MNGIQTSPHRAPRPLRPPQIQFVEAYLTLGGVPAAAAFIGIDRSTGWRWLQQPEVRDELAGRVQEQTRQVQAALLQRQRAAFAVIDALLASDDEKVRLRTAVWIVDNALKLTGPPAATKSVVELQLEALERDLITESAPGIAADGAL